MNRCASGSWAGLVHGVGWLLFALAGIVLATTAAEALAQGSYYGQSDAIILTPTGCNSSDNVPLPGKRFLYIGRQLFRPDGMPLPLESGCRGYPEFSEALKNHRWGLILSKLDWNANKFIFLKALLVPSL